MSTFSNENLTFVSDKVFEATGIKHLFNLISEVEIFFGSFK